MPSTHETPTHATPTHDTPTHDTPTHDTHNHGTPTHDAPTPDQQAENAAADDLLDPLFTDDLLFALAAALPSPEQETDAQRQRRRVAAILALRSFDARAPIEAMLATHAVLAHHHALECYRRAARAGRTSRLDTRQLACAAMLSRSMTSALHSLEQIQTPSTGTASPGAP